MTLTDILQKHKATLSIPLCDGIGASYSEYHAHIQFADGKITVDIYNDEGSHWELGEDGTIDYQWVEQIKAFVDDLKAAKSVPEYTLELLSDIEGTKNTPLQ